ncbi:Eukaryotic translation initiation factor 3 subunit C [Galdieria sulphuraria]|nr:Eukaryotic translation initiation factor 3 subunit C [Galdieria sulphuraria]
MTSRFFATGDTSSSESERTEHTEDSYVSGDESSEAEPNDGNKAKGFEVGERLARYLRDSDSEEGEEKRVVRSARTKQQEALLSIIQQLKNHIKISDWISIQSDFDALNRQLQKFYKVDVLSESRKEPPKAYISAIVLLEDFLNKTAENKDKKLSKTNTKAFNAVKQRLKKNNREWEEYIRKFRESGAIPGEDLHDEDEGTGEGVDEEQEESEANESWDDSEAESLGDSEQAKPATSGGSQWLLKTSGASKGSQATSHKERKKSKSQILQQSGQSFKETFDNIPAIASKDFGITEDLSESAIDQKLVEIIATRGRKGTSKRESLLQLEMLLKVAKTLVQEMEILFQIVSTHFDMTPLSIGYMSQENWRNCVQYIEKILNLAFEHETQVRFVVNHPSTETLDVSVPIRGDKTTSQIEESIESETNGDKNDKRKCVRGDIATLLERMDDDLFRAWQGIDAYLPEYVDRLKDEFVLLKLLAKAQTYFEKEEELDRAARIACRRIQHLYYKPDDLIVGMIQASLQKTRKQLQVIHDEDPVLSGLVYLNETQDESLLLDIPELPIHQRPLKGEQALLRLAVLVYRYGSENLKSIVILCQIYHHALENRYYEARDMLLMSHLQESIGLLELPLQILFNRTMAQLGLCAFRHGLAQETLYCLQELCTPVHTGLGSSTVARLKELLAQGIVQQRGHEKTLEQERLERNYQIPYHMYLPVDFIEMAHLIAAMVIEIPSLTRAEAKNEAPQKRKIYSRVFQHFLRNSIRQAYPSPPENTRDYIMSASRAFIRGHWKDAYQHIASIRAWESIDVASAQSILQTWRNLIQVEGLRTFIHSYASYFDSLSVAFLSEWFELSPARVHSLISKMIMNEELQASWDQPSGCVLIKRWEPNHLQSLCLQLTEKCSQLIDYNERLLDARSGGQMLKTEEREEFLKTASHWMNAGGNRKLSTTENWVKSRTAAS